MEFNDLLTKEAHEEGAEVQINDPITGEPTDLYIKVLGVDSMAFQKSQRLLKNKAVEAYSKDQKIDEGQEIESEIDELVALTIGWRGLESKGKEKKFTPEACKTLYTNGPGVRNQVDRFISNRANFTKG